MSGTTFADLGVPSDLVEVLDRRRITAPFEIQASTIPDALAGRDILGRAPTGSGKTLAFGLPALVRLAAVDRAAKRRPRGLILSPTRELAEQISRELEPLAAAVGRRVLAVYGGTGLGRQITALAKGVDLLVACPGRLLDLIEQGQVRLDEVELAVVDEADRMADMGFLPDVRRLLDQTADERQTLLFSATLDDEVEVLIDRYQHDPALHQVGEVEPDLSLVDHRFIKVEKASRVGLAADLIQDAGPTIVFVRTRHGVDRLARQLRQEGIKAGYIHGGRTQSQRDRALQVFTEGKVDALVATDVAARGIHVDGVACVIHYDPPAEDKDYVHRSGRTARAGAGGTVISFLDRPQVRESEKMRRRLGLEADVESLPARKPMTGRRPVIEGDRPPASTNGVKRQRKPSANGQGAKRPAARRSSSAAGPGQPGAGAGTRSAGPGKPGAGAGTRSAGPGKPAARKAGRPVAKAGKPAGRAGKPVGKAGKPAGKAGKPAAEPGKRSTKVGSSPAARTSKRSGKPRPRNRKNKAGFRRR
jgi:superfamily II DNA/RNA helicase